MNLAVSDACATVSWPVPRACVEFNLDPDDTLCRSVPTTWPRRFDGVQIDPADLVRRRSAQCNGMVTELLQATRLARFSIRIRAPVHTLIVHHQAHRWEGETTVPGVQRATLRDLRRKFSFVPAGTEFGDWQTPRVLAQITCVYIATDVLAGAYAGSTELKPRLLFEDPTLWETVRKLKILLESSHAADPHYFEALGCVLRYELGCILAGQAKPERSARGGLAAWQRRVALDYIEEHLAKSIPLSALADLVRLSPHHFCRAFKESLGRPPLRYQGLRRIERAKVLLAKPDITITEIGLSLGFSDTSSFTAAFRRQTGLTPSTFRRGLE